MHLSDAEWRVMNAVWDRPVESSVRDVLEVVEAQTGWAYQTVQTILLRLTKKGAVRSRMRANTRLYSSTVSRESARCAALRALVDRAFGGVFSELLRELLQGDTLTVEQREDLERTLRSRKR